MLTPFGREVRKLRLDYEPPMKLKDLAEALSVSSAYLSAVETGVRAASPTLVDKVADVLERRAREKNGTASTGNRIHEGCPVGLRGPGHPRERVGNGVRPSFLHAR